MITPRTTSHSHYHENQWIQIEYPLRGTRTFRPPCRSPLLLSIYSVFTSNSICRRSFVHSKGWSESFSATKKHARFSSISSRAAVLPDQVGIRRKIAQSKAMNLSFRLCYVSSDLNSVRPQGSSRPNGYKSSIFCVALELSDHPLDLHYSSRFTLCSLRDITHEKYDREHV